MMPSHEVHELHDLNDPRLLPYRNLSVREPAVEGPLFIAEGALLVRRLLDSPIAVHSVVLARFQAQRYAPLARGRAPVYIVPDELSHEVVGFRFHSGVIAAGWRPAPAAPEAGPLTPEAAPEAAPEASRDSSRGVKPAAIRLGGVLLACPRLSNYQNLGAIIRSGAALGAAGLLLGPECCDPWARQAVRVSMGSVFTLPVTRCPALEPELRRLRDRGCELHAAVLDPHATPLEKLRLPAAKPVVLLLGPEDRGLDPELVQLCDRRVTLTMSGGTDSLNVAAAAAVFLYHYLRLARQPEA
jgi:tRNA G18 (ribose-2'-O)-methylase SpoU